MLESLRIPSNRLTIIQIDSDEVYRIIVIYRFHRSRGTVVEAASRGCDDYH